MRYRARGGRSKCPLLYRSDKRALRIDGLTRHNAGAALGDVVAMKKVEAPPAERVELSGRLAALRQIVGA